MSVHAVAHAAAKARQAVVERLRDGKATRSGAAIPLSALSAMEQRMLYGLTKAGVVREAAPRQYYLDERAWLRAEERRATVQRWILLAVIFVLLVGLALALAQR